jgi:hypothetical protein
MAAHLSVTFRRYGKAIVLWLIAIESLLFLLKPNWAYNYLQLAKITVTVKVYPTQVTQKSKPFSKYILQSISITRGARI